MLGPTSPLATAAPQTSTHNAAATPVSPERRSRLRGLSLLRGVTARDNPSSPPPQDPQLRETDAASVGVPLRNENTPLASSSEVQQVNITAKHNVTQGVHSNIPAELGTLERSMTRNRRVSAAVGPTPAPVRVDSTSAHSEPSRSPPTDDGPSITSLTGITAVTEVFPSIRFISYSEGRARGQALFFEPILRTLTNQNSVVRVGRYSERDILTAPAATSTTPVGFKSKVVSRRHCEFWCEDGQWYVKDCASSSGTFLGNRRLSPANSESAAHAVRDGDVVQLGVDFKGGEELIFRCVRMRVELNRGWQKQLNAYNTNQHRKLLAVTKVNSDSGSEDGLECSICLGTIGPCQAVFVAPCTHAWHFKCISRALNGANYPFFMCPNCRLWSDLNEDPDGEVTTEGPLDDVPEAEEESVNEEPGHLADAEVEDASEPIEERVVSRASLEALGPGAGFNRNWPDPPQAAQDDANNAANAVNDTQLSNREATLEAFSSELRPVAGFGHLRVGVHNPLPRVAVNNALQENHVAAPRAPPPPIRVVRPRQDTITRLNQAALAPRILGGPIDVSPLAARWAASNGSSNANDTSSRGPDTTPASPATPTNSATHALAVMSGSREPLDLGNSPYDRPDIAY